MRVTEGIIADKRTAAKKIIKIIKDNWKAVYNNDMSRDRETIGNFMNRLNPYDIIVTDPPGGPGVVAAYGSFGDRNFVILNYRFFEYSQEEILSKLLTGRMPADRIVRLRPAESVNWEMMETAVEHELIHKEQHARTGKIDSAVLKRRIRIPDDLAQLNDPDKLEYINQPAELMPHVRSAANSIMDVFKKGYRDFAKDPANIGFTRDQKIEVFKHSFNTLLYTTFQTSEGLKQFNRMFEYIKYYTPQNRKRYFKLLYQTLQRDFQLLLNGFQKTLKKT